MLCVPIVYEKESLGVFCVDNIHSKRSLTQTDMSLLVGIASQTAVSIISARAFQQVKESEKKYRDLVENANSIILRIDPEGTIAFFNEFAQELLGYNEKALLGKSILETIIVSKQGTDEEFDYLVESLSQNPEKRIVREEKVRAKSGKA